MLVFVPETVLVFMRLDLLGDVIVLRAAPGVELRIATFKISSCRRKFLYLTDCDVLTSLVLHNLGRLKTASLQHLAVFVVLKVCSEE